jgi:hypothetical protein
MLVVALSLSEQVEKIGAYAGIAAFFGFAVLSILTFAQAREIKRLRDWAGRAPERAAELEARVMADAASRARQPVRPATPAAVPAPAANGEAAKPAAAAATTGAAPATAVVPEKPADEEAKPDETEKAEDAKPAEAEKTEEAKPAEDGKADAEAEKVEAEKAPVAAGAAAAAVAAAAAPATPAVPPAAKPAATPGNGTGAGEVPPLPRATPAPRPGAATPAPRPRPGAAPLRAGGPAARRPAPAPAARRPAAAPDEGRSGGRLAALIAGGVLGLVVLVFAVTQIFGGEDESPPPNRPVTETTAEPTAEAGGEDTGGGGSSSSTPSKAETTVAVLNGTFTSGLAASTADKVAGAGFKKGTVGDYSDQARAASLVFYTDGMKSRALQVAKLLGIPSSSVEPVSDSENPAQGADVVVVVGADQTQ